MNPRQLFESHLDVIDRAIRRVCRDVRLAGADAEDFASTAKLALLANDCAVLTKFEGRSSLATYVTVVVRRLFADQRRAEGRFTASTEARRRGEHAVLLDRLLHHERNTFAEAAAIVKQQHPEVAVSELREIADVLPDRAARPRLIHIEEDDAAEIAGGDAADARVLERDTRERSAAVSAVVSAAMASMSAQDRVLLRLRFAKGAAVSDIARALGVEQRPLYRRIDSLLAGIRRALQQAGVDAASVEDLIGSPGNVLDFGLRAGEGSGGTP
jgi:RNA polymerase sigma factor (sigma-70 family)